MNFDQWCIVELFGHQRIAGRVTEQQIGGCPFVRVDVPESNGKPGYTKFYGNGAIYAMSITDEETARAAVQYLEPLPIEAWTIRNMVQAALPDRPDQGDDETEPGEPEDEACNQEELPY